MRHLVTSAVTRAAQSAAMTKFVALLERVARERSNLLRVLTYHRIDWPSRNPQLDPGMISATPKVFREQIEYLATHFRVLSMVELLERQHLGRPVPPRSVVLTFDDAYSDFAENAWPILKSHGVPATLFVPTAYPDHPEKTFWWDRLYHAIGTTRCTDPLPTPLGCMRLLGGLGRQRVVRMLRTKLKMLPHRVAMSWVDQICKRLGHTESQHMVLNWGKLRQLAQEGLTVAAHTRTHCLLNRVTAEQARSELVRSLSDLEREIGSVPPVFAYPSGAWNNAVVEVLRREQIALAFTTTRGINNLNNCDTLRLRRINMGKRTTHTVLRAQLLPWQVHLNRWMDTFAA